MTDHKGPPAIDELSVSVALSEHGLKAGVRSRAAIALDRLVGNTFGLINAYAEKKIHQVEAASAVEHRLIEREGEVALKKLEKIPGIGDRLIERFMQDQARRQGNQESIAREAIETLKALPPPDEAAVEKPLDEDWLNLFATHAENASSERLQKMWGRILAGEIRKPGSYSLTTLRFISELDQEIASIFERHVRSRLSDGFLPKPVKPEGDQLVELTFLEEVGLLQEVSGHLGKPLTALEDGHIYYCDADITMPGTIFLRMKATLARLELIRITRTGQEIASILPKQLPIVALEAVAAQMTNKTESMEICRTDSSAGTTIAWTSVRTIKAPPNNAG